MAGLIETSEAGEGLIVTVGGGDRLAVYVFAHPEGVVFVEDDWCNPLTYDRFPFHLVQGEITGDGPWMVGGVPFRRIRPDERAAEYMKAYRDYHAAHPERCSREGAAAIAASEFPHNSQEG